MKILDPPLPLLSPERKNKRESETCEKRSQDSQDSLSLFLLYESSAGCRTPDAGCVEDYHNRSCAKPVEDRLSLCCGLSLLLPTPPSHCLPLPNSQTLKLVPLKFSPYTVFVPLLFFFSTSAKFDATSKKNNDDKDKDKKTPDRSR